MTVDLTVKMDCERELPQITFGACHVLVLLHAAPTGALDDFSLNPRALLPAHLHCGCRPWC